jgi:lipopolysaccharide transport system ATP-binding protein
MQVSGVSLHFPVLLAGSRSIKNEVVQSVTGGRIGELKGHKIVEALENVTFTLREGDRVGLIGHNGAGKTTLLRVLNGIYPPTTGVVSAYGRIGSLINISFGIDPSSTGRENIFIRSALMGVSRAAVRDRYQSIVDFAELGEFIDLPVKTYSSGMTMRLAFSIATEFPADILLMDEWLGVGDQSFRGKVARRLDALTKRTGILVLASHSRPILTSVCNRLIWLDHGHVKMDGPTEEVAEIYFRV